MTLEQLERLREECQRRAAIGLVQTPEASRQRWREVFPEFTERQIDELCSIAAIPVDQDAEDDAETEETVTPSDNISRDIDAETTRLRRSVIASGAARKPGMPLEVGGVTILKGRGER